MELQGFKKLYSTIIKDHFLDQWVSDDQKYYIVKALRGSGYHLQPYSSPMDQKWWDHKDRMKFFNIKSPEEALELYEKYFK